MQDRGFPDAVKSWQLENPRFSIVADSASGAEVHRQKPDGKMGICNEA